MKFTMAIKNRYQVSRDGLTTRPRFSRRWAVVDTTRLDSAGEHEIVLQTDDAGRAIDVCHEYNSRGD